MRHLAKKMLFTLGIILAYTIPYRKSSDLFFFFPFYHVGGAEKVHKDILALASFRKPWIIITNRSNSAIFLEKFAKAGKLLDLSLLIGNCVLESVVSGYLVTAINRCKKALVFGSNSPFFYKLLPCLKTDVYCVDLIHSFGGEMETISLPYLDRINRRIVINLKTYEDLKNQYSNYGIPQKLTDRIDLVENKVEMPEVLPQLVRSEKLRALYIGRGSEEKRVHLVGKIARVCHDKGLPVEFTLVGDVKDAVDVDDRQYCRFTGELHDPKCIEIIYRNSDLLLVTSSREGFPVVIMEAMANGVVPVTTDVGGIRYHVRNGQNGFLVPSHNENEIVNTFVAIIEHMNLDSVLLDKLSESAHEYAATNFKGEKFDSYYCILFAMAHS